MDALKFAAALVAIMKDTEDHHIIFETGLPNDDCKLIARARKDAQALLDDFDLRSMRVLRAVYKD